MKLFTIAIAAAISVALVDARGGRKKAYDAGSAYESRKSATGGAYVYKSTSSSYVAPTYKPSSYTYKTTTYTKPTYYNSGSSYTYTKPNDYRNYYYNPTYDNYNNDRSYWNTYSDYQREEAARER
jgi:hypothetical protein